MDRDQQMRYFKVEGDELTIETTPRTTGADSPPGHQYAGLGPGGGAARY